MGRRRWTRWRRMRRTAVSGRMGLLVWTNFFLSTVSNFDHYSWGTLLWLFKCSSPIATQSAHVREISWFWWKPLKAGQTYFSNVIPIIRASFGMISGSRGYSPVKCCVSCDWRGHGTQSAGLPYPIHWPLPLDTQSFERLLYRRSAVGVVYLRSKRRFCRVSCAVRR